MARRFGRRRKPRVVWLQNVGTADWSPDINLGENPAYVDATVGITMGGGRTPTVNIPLVQDGPSFLTVTGSASTAGFGLATWDRQDINSLMQWGYRLRRVVGKLHISVNTGAPGNPGPTDKSLAGLRVTAGLIIRRVDPETGQALAFSGSAEGVNTQAIENIRDPWIWRRSWTLSNASLNPLWVIAGTNTGPVQDDTIMTALYPSTTAGYGSVADGPTVDQKTARNVGPQERLFLDVSYRNIVSDAGVPTDWATNIFFDYRVLASLRSNMGNRRNASR